MDKLTPRQRQVLWLIVAGKSNLEIAAELFIAPQTTKNHVSAIYRRMGVRSRTEAAVKAIRTGMVSIDIQKHTQKHTKRA